MRATVSALDGTFGADGIRQLAQTLERGAGRVGGGFGTAQGIDAAPDEDR